MASSNYSAWSVVAGEQPTTAKWNILGTNDAAFNTGQGFNDAILGARHFDWANLFQLNIKSALSTSGSGLSAGDSNLGSLGASVSVTVANSCKAFVTVSMGIQATSDYEFQPEIWLDNSVNVKFTPSAATSTGGRASVRGFSSAVTLTAGTHTLSAGVSIINGAGWSISSGAASIAVIILGNVTA